MRVKTIPPRRSLVAGTENRVLEPGNRERRAGHDSSRRIIGAVGGTASCAARARRLTISCIDSGRRSHAAVTMFNMAVICGSKQFPHGVRATPVSAIAKPSWDIPGQLCLVCLYSSQVMCCGYADIHHSGRPDRPDSTGIMSPLAGRAGKWTGAGSGPEGTGCMAGARGLVVHRPEHGAREHAPNRPWRGGPQLAPNGGAARSEEQTPE